MAVDIPVRVIIDAIDNASKSFQNVAQSAGNLTDSWKTLGIAGAALGVGVGLLAKDFITQAGAMEQNQIAFETMIGSATKAKTLLEQIQQFAKTTPFNVQELVEGSKRLLAYNTSAEDLIPTLDALGNIAAGVGRDKLPDLIRAFGQVQAKGKLMAQELNQFAEAGVPLRDMLAKDLKMSLEEFSTELDKGNLDIKFDQVRDSLFKLTGEGGRFHNLMQEQSKSTLGQLSNLQDAWTRLSITLGTVMKPATDSVIASVMTLVEGLNRWAQNNPQLAAGILSVVGGIALIGAAILPVMGALSIFNAGFVVLTSLIGAILTPVGLFVGLGVALTAIVLGLITHFGLWNETLTIFSTIFSALYNSFILTIPAIGLLGQAFDALGISQMNVKVAQEQLQQATENLKNAQDNLRGATTSLEGAQLMVERATINAANATKTYGKDSLEAREASHNLKVAQDNLDEAQKNVKESADKVSAAQEDVKKKTDAAAEASKQAKEKVDALTGTFNSLASAIGGAIAKFVEFAAKKVADWNGGNSGRQFGGPVSGANSYIVGEAGQEQFTPQTAGYITPHGKYDSKGSGSGGPTIQFIINADLIVNSPTERRNLAEAIYADLVTLARSQNMSVAEMMGG